MRSSVKRWLREPLLQFLVAGALLFAAYRALHPEAFRPADDNRIEVTADDLRQLEIAWTAQWRRPPTPDEMRGLVDARVREEILYREALTLGLERGDAIVKRRLAQKMEFLAERCVDAARSNCSRLAGVVRKQRGTFCRAWTAIVPSRLLLYGPSGDAGPRRCRELAGSTVR